MEHNESISLIAGVIQLAVAPVFLLAGIGAILSVLSLRLGRVTDRARLSSNKAALKIRIATLSVLQARILLAARLRRDFVALRAARSTHPPP